MTTGSVPERDLAYTSGSWVAVASSDCCLLAELDPGAATVQHVWEIVRAGASADDVLAELLDQGFRTVPSFALYDAQDNRLVLRGTARARISDGDGTELVDAPQVRTWLDRHLPDDMRGLTLIGEQATEERAAFPIGSGVVLAGTVRISLASSPDAGEPRVDIAAAVVVAEAETPASTDAPPEDVLADIAPAHVAPPDIARPDIVAPPTTPIAASVTADVAFDHLFGATQNFDLPSPPALAIDIEGPPGLSEIPDVAPAPEPLPTISPLQSVEETLQPADVDDSVHGGAVIDSMPWEVDDLRGAPAVAAVPSFDPAPVPDSGDDGEPAVASMTTSRAELLAADDAPPHSGPTVLAARCPEGHLSPAYAGTCRICSEPLGSNGAFTAPRPVLGVLALSTGARIPLDRGVLLGRSPSQPEGSDPERPHVVKVASEKNDISRTHAEVRLDGWHVLVIDLDSTNGTTVTAPGRPPQRLRPHDPMAIEPGTEVSLADEVRFRYELPT